MQQVQKKIQSQLGSLYLVATQRALRGVFWVDPQISPVREGSPASQVLESAENQIEEYLAGQRQEFDLLLEVVGTDFQVRVWSELQKIPYGNTRSYQFIAEAVGVPGASRAVGRANAQNPLSLIIPCHRVINKNGEWGGYAGGLTAKKQLLDLELHSMGRHLS